MGEAGTAGDYRGIRLSRDGLRIVAAREDPEIGANMWTIAPGGPTDVTGSTIARLKDTCGNLIQLTQLAHY